MSIEHHDNPLYYRELEGGDEIVVYPMLYGKARLCVCDPFPYNGYCYDDPQLAILAAMLWDGESEPLDGWHRNPFDGRRRPGGDRSREEVRG